MKKTQPTRLPPITVPPEMVDGLATIKQRDGVSVAEQVRRALSAWLNARLGRKVSK